MRIRTLLIAATALAACSAPKPSTPAAARDLRLGTSPVRDTAVVSALESGRPLPRPRIAPTPTPRATPSAVAAALTESAAPRLVLATARTTLAEPTHDFKEAAEPIEVLVATGPGPETAPGLGIQSGFMRGGSGPGAWTTGRQGGVIIRGGVGGIDDDCDIRHPHSSPIAIHSVGPNFRGGIH